MVDYGINIGKLFFVGLLGVLVTVDIVVGLQALYYWQSNQTEAVESLYQQPAELKKLQEAQRNSLTEYRMVDAGKKTVSIPIARAMELVVQELSQKNGKNDSSQGELR